MDLRDLVRALLAYDELTARQWVADAARADIKWNTLPRPADLDPIAMAVAAGIVETLAKRVGQRTAPWTGEVPAAPEAVFLVRAARTMPRLRRMCEEEGPEPLRRRRLMAPPDFLTAA